MDLHGDKPPSPNGRNIDSLNTNKKVMRNSGKKPYPDKYETIEKIHAENVFLCKKEQI